MIFIVLAGFLLNGNKSKYCVLPDPCAGVPEVPGAGYARLWLAVKKSYSKEGYYNVATNTVTLHIIISFHVIIKK